jgi:hypothetical protein
MGQGQAGAVACPDLMKVAESVQKMKKVWNAESRGRNDYFVEYTWSFADVKPAKLVWSEPTFLPLVLKELAALDCESARRPVFVVPLDLQDAEFSPTPLLRYGSSVEAVQGIGDDELPVVKLSEELDAPHLAKYEWSYGDINVVAKKNPLRWSKYQTLPRLLNEFFPKNTLDEAKRPVRVKNQSGGDWTFDSFKHAVEIICEGQLPLEQRGSKRPLTEVQSPLEQ